MRRLVLVGSDSSSSLPVAVPTRPLRFCRIIRVPNSPICRRNTDGLARAGRGLSRPPLLISMETSSAGRARSRQRLGP